MRVAVLLAWTSVFACAQRPLQDRIRAIAADAHGKVSVACALPGSNLNCDLNPHAHPPMQSVFKLPLGLATLHLVEQGALSLDQQIRFLPADRILPKTYSPLQDKYPGADVDIPLRELLRLAVSESDNAAADLILRTIGGPPVVQGYMKSLGIGGFHIEDGEHALHRDPAAQYRNWFEPAAAVQLLRRISDHSPLTEPHTRLILDWLRDTPRALNRLKGGVPQGTLVMHKPGTSFTANGLTAATNDIGLIALPDGRRLATAVFVTDSTADEATRDGVIARIAKAVFEQAVNR